MNAFTIRVLKADDEKNLRTVLNKEFSDPTAVQAMRPGAYDFLTKPFKTGELKAILERANENKKILSENPLLKTQIKRQPEIPGIDPGNLCWKLQGRGVKE